MTEALLSAPEPSDGGESIPVSLIAEGALDGLSPFEQGLASAADFKGKAGQALAIPGADGRTARELLELCAPARVEATLVRGVGAERGAGG